jgi:hypothetical protein
MKPDAVYIFEQCPGAHTRYKLIEHSGADIPDFPATWVNNCKGGKAGEKYIGFRHTVNHKAGHRRFEYTLELDKARTVTGLNFAYDDNPYIAFGDYGADAVLVRLRFTCTKECITVMFFKGKKEAAQALFQSWAAGELLEAAAVEALPPVKKKPDS